MVESRNPLRQKLKSDYSLLPSSDNCQLSTVNCQLSTVNCQLSTVNCQLSTVNCQLFKAIVQATVQ
ncbi:hypothetical protein [Microcoleus sp. PH2017_16_JOR_D_A]|uniref:hypothetical protein n=1 Tax=Microcoleus sp. PH2017_16_JOR_D_A TaxID=2798827 RepID=UPI0025F4C941|nr:hypothetical protein [Microcoleus sp. PH2017_16_JOR_D_A]